MAPSLADEHDQLLRQVAVRAEDLLAAGDGGRSPAMLASAVRDLLRQLEAHLAAEEAILAVPGRGGAPATTAVGAHPHEWYPLTGGTVIDLDTLPPDQAVAAAAQRLLRLDCGEQAELRSSSDPARVWQRLEELAPGRCRFAYLEDGPGRWRLQVPRREQP